jgi:hypothetical protein
VHKNKESWKDGGNQCTMNEYEDAVDQSSSQRNRCLGSDQASSSNQERRRLSAVIDPRLYMGAYSEDGLGQGNEDPTGLDISSDSSVDYSSGAESSWSAPPSSALAGHN